MSHGAVLADALDAGQLNLIVLPTEKCNFDCVYCYEDHEVGAMGADVIQGIEKLIERRAPTLRSLRVSWFGGEPLLQLSTVRRLSKFCVSTAERFEGISYEADMTTNGYLLGGELALELSALGVKTYQISLDGDQEQHDKTRVRRGGQGSFARIYKNLRDVQATSANLRVLIRIHYTAQTYEALDPLIERINADFGEDPRFTVHFKAIEPLGGPNNGRIAKVDRTEQARIYGLLTSKLKTSAQVERIDSLSVCYASAGNSFLIYPTGEIGKCTVALHDPRNVVGTLDVDGRMRLERSVLFGWLRGLETREADWLACPWRRMKAAESTQASTTDRYRLPVVR